MAWSKRGRPRWRAFARLILVFTALMTGGFAVPSDIEAPGYSKAARGDRLVYGYCEPEPELVPECPPPRVETVPGDLTWPTAFILVLAAGGIGYAFGWAGVDKRPDRTAVQGAVSGAAAPHIASAIARNETVAELMLQNQQRDILTALKGFRLVP